MGHFTIRKRTTGMAAGMLVRIRDIIMRTISPAAAAETAVAAAAAAHVRYLLRCTARQRTVSTESTRGI